MKIYGSLFITALLAQGPTTSHACPFSETADEIPNDLTHKGLRGRRLASLSDDKSTRLKLASIISERKRSLQNESCVSTNVYESIRTTIDEMANNIGNLGDRGHFLGGIVRLAAVSNIFLTNA